MRPPPVNFPFSELEHLARICQRSMLLIGGGEPLLYRSGRRFFCDLVGFIRRQMPHIQLGLVSNGTHAPRGEWAHAFRWIRYSLDAATPSTYAEYRGKRLFDRVCANVVATLRRTRHTRVGVGYLYSAANIHEAALAARALYDLVRRSYPDGLDRFSIQYRPLRRDPKDEGRAFPAAISLAERNRCEAEFISLARRDSAFAGFLRDSTNCEVIAGGNEQAPLEFGRCHYSTVFRIVRANGDLRPCFIRVVEPEFLLGNLTRDPPEKIALNALYMAAFLRPGCDRHGCRQCHVNWILEAGLRGEIEPSKAPSVADDPFF